MTTEESEQWYDKLHAQKIKVGGILKKMGWVASGSDSGARFLYNPNTKETFKCTAFYHFDKWHYLQVYEESLINA